MSDNESDEEQQQQMERIGNPSDGNPEAQGLKSENDVRVDHLKEPKPAELGGGVQGEEDDEKSLAVAKASSPPKAHISLNADEKWSTFQTQEEGKLDIFLVLLHEIGHALGLRHSGDENSVMFPMFERPVGDHLPVISNDDVERLRALYVLFAKKKNSVGARMRVKRDSALISDAVAAGDEDNSVVLCCVCPVPLTLGELKKKKPGRPGKPKNGTKVAARRTPLQPAFLNLTPQKSMPFF
uniref:Peptidase_M10 domain-containing protein n=1 Tax=Globodera pallida TaxID=36090 RepID=A0A183BX79_GLOPA